MDLKKPLTFDEQLDKLAAHGMIIRDREKAKTNPRFAGKTGNPNHKHLRQMEEKPRQKF